MQKRFRHTFISFLTVIGAFTAQAQTLVSSEPLGTLSTSGLNQLIAFLSPGTTVDNGITYYKITYNTVDVAGAPTVASGMVVVPTITDCDSFPMAVYCHGTVLRKTDVPSEDNGESLIGKLFGGRGYVTVLPDYLGLGVNPGPHPYLHAESQATASLDAVRAAREFIADSFNLTHNEQLFITGYSQGGHAAMATLKYIEDNNLTTEFQVTAAAPASGPYFLSGTQADVLLSSQPYSNPGYVVYLLSSYQLAYGNLFNSWSDILRPPYDQQAPPLLDGSVSMDVLNNLLPQVLDSFLVDTVLANVRNSIGTFNHPLWQALLDNDNYDWTPQAPVRMYYCTADEQVDFGNSLVADSAMNANGAPNVRSINSGPLTHGGCVVPALLAVDVFFDSLQVACTVDTTSGGPSSVREVSGSTVRIYPNPAGEQLFIDATGAYQVDLYDVTGRQWNTGFQRGDQSISVREYPQGVYFLRVHTEEGVHIERVVLQP